MDRNSNFANPDGHLSVASVIQVNSDDQIFDQILKVPVRQFPQAALASPIKVRGVVVLDGENLYSEMVDLTTPLPPDTAETPDGSSDNGGQTQPSNGGPSGAGYRATGAGISGAIH